MFQADTGYSELQTRWSIRRDVKHSGLIVDGLPLNSVHTHWITNDFITKTFNTFIKEYLGKLAPRHNPAKQLLSIIA